MYSKVIYIIKNIRAPACKGGCTNVLNETGSMKNQPAFKDGVFCFYNEVAAFWIVNPANL